MEELLKNLTPEMQGMVSQMMQNGGPSPEMLSQLMAAGGGPDPEMLSRAMSMMGGGQAPQPIEGGYRMTKPMQLIVTALPYANPAYRRPLYLLLKMMEMESYSEDTLQIAESGSGPMDFLTAAKACLEPRERIMAEVFRQLLTLKQL